MIGTSHHGLRKFGRREFELRKQLLTYDGFGAAGLVTGER